MNKTSAFWTRELIKLSAERVPMPFLQGGPYRTPDEEFFAEDLSLEDDGGGAELRAVLRP